MNPQSPVRVAPVDDLGNAHGDAHGDAHDARALPSGSVRWRTLLPAPLQAATRQGGAPRPPAGRRFVLHRFEADGGALAAGSAAPPTPGERRKLPLRRR
jgi:hypothetical protein